MFLSMNTKKWKQPKRPSKYKEIFKLCNIQAIKYYVAGKVIQVLMAYSKCSINVNPIYCFIPISAVAGMVAGSWCPTQETLITRKWKCILVS